MLLIITYFLKCVKNTVVKNESKFKNKNRTKDPRKQIARL